MDDLLDMIISDESPSQVSDKIKDILFAKSAGKVDEYRTDVASAIFGAETEEGEIDNDDE
jgi:hypothetical protein